MTDLALPERNTEMSTIQDFENAPVGATATHEDGGRAMKMDDVDRGWVTPARLYLDSEELEYRGFTLDPFDPSPTTVQEALDLAWELAHPVKEGQMIPEGTEFIQLGSDNTYMHGRVGSYDHVAVAWDEEHFRTLEPLPEPEPDWLDAPAVLAWYRADDLRREKVWSEINDGWYRSLDGEVVTWPDLDDVTPLYPEGEKE